jgi:uncharacterized membrane-anchored protein YjiN (DUF445 family)
VAHDSQDQERALSRIQWISTALLLVVIALYIVARRFEHRYPDLAILAAFSEAAMVGALADWFAVVALFRYPMGIPFPHTAIIPKNKGRIADNLGAFITGNFLRTDVILQRIRAFDPAARMAQWLSRPESGAVLGAYGVRALGFGLKAIEDQRVHHFIHDAVVARLEQIDFSIAGGELLDVMTQGGRHQQLLDETLHQLKVLLGEAVTQEKVAELIAKEFKGWRKYLFGAVPIDEMIGSYSAKKLVAAVARLLDEVDANPDHPLRQRFDRFVAEFIVKLKTDPAFRLKGEQIRDQILRRPELAEYLRGLWTQFRTWLDADLQSPDSSIRQRIVAATGRAGEALRADPEMQSWINDQILAAARPLCAEHRESIGRFISEQVKAWDERYMVKQLELNIGKDLQYIRINGTLIGGAIGLLIYGGTALIRA